MPVLTLNLLGPFMASLDDQPVYSFRTNKAQALLVYLALEKDHPHRREALMELLWPDMPLESAQINLRQTIYRLRQSIPQVSSKRGPSQVSLLLTDRQAVQLNPDGNVRVDVSEFRTSVEHNPARAVALYRGDFLADFYLVDSSAFEAWAECTREQLRRQAVGALEGLAQHCLQQGKYDQAQTYAWRQLEIDRLREPAYRQLMLALAGDGQRNAALSQYQICQQLLREELGVEPAEETQKLYEQIHADAQRQVQKVIPQKPFIPANNKLVFMLTDIENSTQLWDTYRQAMLVALLRHNAILEEQINRHGGRILELRGDGVKAVFETGNPLACALAIQIDFAAMDWGEIGSVKIRIGLHGVPTVRRDFDYFKEDDKYYGPVLNHTARIMDAGWGGQILVSEQVHNGFSLPYGASWQDFGQHTVRSLDHPVHIFGLTHPDLPHAFPPLRTLSTPIPAEPAVSPPRPRHNLASPPTAFIGRQKELADLVGLLANPAVRLITIVGPGGMGKSRLALEIAENLVEHCTPDQAYLFPDGVFFISLVSLNEPEQMIPAISITLNVPLDASQSTETLERGSQTTTTQKENLLGYLASRRLLLILDNLEHLVDGAEIISGLLEAAPAIQILVTSRERLHIREEQVYPIQGLEFPDRETPGDPCEYTAIELFLQSAHRLQPDFEVDSKDISHLTRICRLVGGMPLGLELAASWIDTLSLQEIAAEIQKSLDFLESDLRNIPDRHRSMRAVFDSSWKCLSDSEKLIFARLSIFRGSFTRAAAEAIAEATLRALSILVSKSLVQYDQESHRYQVHELLRQYGAEQLAADPHEKFETSRRHSSFYCADVEHFLSLFTAGQPEQAINQPKLEGANIRTAWEWAVAHAELEHLNKAIDGLCIFYHWSWQVSEALATCDSVLEMFNKQDLIKDNKAVLAKRLQAKTLYWKSSFIVGFNLDQAVQMLDQSLSIVNLLFEMEIDAREEKCQIRFFQGLVNYESGDLKTSKVRFEDSLALSREIGFHWMSLRNLAMLGDVARTMGEPSEARLWYAQGLAEARVQGNLWGEITALHDLGWAARSLIAYPEAQSYFEESLNLAKTRGNRIETAQVLQSSGFLYLFLGQLDQALERFSESAQISNDIGLPYRSLPSRIHIGVTRWLSGDLALAEAIIRETVAISQDLDPAARIFPTICLAEILVILGRYQEAHVQIQLLNELTHGILLDRFMNGRFTRISGWLALAVKKYPEARAMFEKSIELYQVITDDEQIAWSQVGLAAVAIHQGNLEEARQLLIEALWTTFEIRGFIPLLFALPIVCLYLARENPEQARFVYAQIQHSPFLVHAPLFKDIVYRYLPSEITAAMPVIEPASADLDLGGRLWTTASSILASWMKVWMEESEVIDDETVHQPIALQRQAGAPDPDNE